MNLSSPPHTKQPLICLNPPYMFEYFIPTWKYLEKGRRCSLAEGMCIPGVSFGISEESSYFQCVFSLFLPVQQDAVSQGLSSTLYSCSSNTYLWKPEVQLSDFCYKWPCSWYFAAKINKQRHVPSSWNLRQPDFELAPLSYPEYLWHLYVI